MAKRFPNFDHTVAEPPDQPTPQCVLYDYLCIFRGCGPTREPAFGSAGAVHQPAGGLPRTLSPAHVLTSRPDPQRRARLNS